MSPVSKIAVLDGNESGDQVYLSGAAIEVVANRSQRWRIGGDARAILVESDLAIVLLSPSHLSPSHEG